MKAKTLSVILAVASCLASQDPITNPSSSEQVFTYHSAVVAGWAEVAFDTNLIGLKQPVPLFLEGLHFTEQTVSRRTAENFVITSEGVAVHVGLRAYSDAPYMDAWLRIVYGHRGTAQATWQRLKLDVAGSVQIAVDNTPGQVGHGQGIMVRWRYDFAKKAQVPMRLLRRRARGLAPPPYFTLPNQPSWLKIPARPTIEPPRPFEQTSYVPAFPGRTGDQQNFGFFHILADIWSNQNRELEWWNLLSTEAGRAGHWFNADGSIVLDDTPTTNLLVGGAAFHKKCKGYETQAWFKPEGDWTARSPRGIRWRHWDTQHWGLGPLSQVVWLYGDLGLLWECEHLAGTWLFSEPFESRGTTHYTPSNARGNGRKIQSGAGLYWALADHNPVLAEKIRVRLLRHLELQCDFWQKNGVISKDRGSGQQEASVWMHAEWVNGLAASLHVPMDETFRLRVVKTGTEIAHWILGSFKEWHGGGHWAIPYIVDREGNAISAGPSNGLTTWCIGALQMLDAHAQDSMSAAEKMRAGKILNQWVHNRTPPVGGGLPRWMEWLIR